jgi:hypothetical protein
VQYVGFTVSDHPSPGLHCAVDHLISDGVIPSAETKITAMSERTGGSLYQELEGIIPSQRVMLLLCKSKLKRLMNKKPAHPVERQLVELFGRE